MKILVIPELDWIAALQNRVHNIFQRLSKNHEVHVLYFESVKNGIKRSYRLKSNVILHKPKTIYFRNMLLFYMINSISIYSYINHLIRSYNIEIIVTTNFLFAPFAMRAARKNTIPIVFDLVDFQSYHVNYIKFIPPIFKKLGKFLLTSLLNFDINHADSIITTGLPLFRYIKQKGIQNITIISNGVDNRLFNPSNNGVDIKKQYKITSPIICFIGALEYWVDYHSFFNSISLLQEQFPTLHCLFIGPSWYYGINEIKRIAAEYKVLNRIIFTGRLSYNQLPSYICASDICVLPFIKNYLTHCIIPMKLFEYLACERPVVSVPLAGVKSIAKNTIFYADTPVDLRDKIKYILTNKKEIREKIQLGSALVKKYIWTDLAHKYMQTLEQICLNYNK